MAQNPQESHLAQTAMKLPAGLTEASTTSESQQRRHRYYEGLGVIPGYTGESPQFLLIHRTFKVCGVF